MQTPPFRKNPRTLIYLFLGFTCLCGIGWAVFSSEVVDFRVLLAGNALLFAIGFYSLRLAIKALYHKNIQVFLRLLYSSLLLKLFLISVAAFIYIAHFRQALNKPALFGCFGLYLIYTFTEVRLVMQQSKRKNA
ncbi:MAG: hypothetical protein Q8918_10710 [Bacteroidota bacterium]|nr:hypothetical protein [Bacteroidota bacterium]MDP4250568.1 hypothetical protein [Bacteroidota bacterium]